MYEDAYIKVTRNHIASGFKMKLETKNVVYIYDVVTEVPVVPGSSSSTHQMMYPNISTTSAFISDSSNHYAGAGSVVQHTLRPQGPMSAPGLPSYVLTGRVYTSTTKIGLTVTIISPPSADKQHIRFDSASNTPSVIYNDGNIKIEWPATVTMLTGPAGGDGISLYEEEATAGDDVNEIPTANPSRIMRSFNDDDRLKFTIISTNNDPNYPTYDGFIVKGQNIQGQTSKWGMLLIERHY